MVATMLARSAVLGMALIAGAALLAPGAGAQLLAPQTDLAQAAPPAPPLAPAAEPAPPGFIDELKLGVLDHDVGFLTHHVESGQDVNLEVLFTSPWFLSILGSPRPHLGADINDDGNTSDGYFGLTWGIKPLQWLYGGDDRLFLNGSLGGAYQDGYIDHAPPGRKRLGSPVLFRESAELGYQLTPVISVSALLDHISNANLGRHNAGITSAGARLGFKF
jgi:lipid A 3-O-deacylase